MPPVSLSHGFVTAIDIKLFFCILKLSSGVDRFQKNIGVSKYSAYVGLSDGLGQVNTMVLSSIGFCVSDLFVLSSVFPFYLPFCTES